MTSIAEAQQDIQSVTFVRPRQMGNKFWVDIGIQISKELTVDQADKIARNLRIVLLRQVDSLREVTVSVSAARGAGHQRWPNGRLRQLPGALLHSPSGGRSIPCGVR